jgi:DNA-binding winged helix-turn-helix (wHTH) protein
MTDNKCFVFRFDDVEVRDREFILTKAGEVLPIEPKAFRVLQYLLRNPQKLVTKDELLEAVWSDVSVSENSVARAIAQLRRLLGDDPREPRYILTVPTLGYRFLYEVAAREDGFGSGFATGATLPEGGNESEQSHGTDGAGDSPAGHPAEGLGILSGGLDEKGRVVSSSRKLRAHKLLFAWTAAALLLFVVVFVFRRLMGTSPTPTPNPPRLAMEERLTANPPQRSCDRCGGLTRWQVPCLRGSNRTLSAPDFQWRNTPLEPVKRLSCISKELVPGRDTSIGGENHSAVVRS